MKARKLLLAMSLVFTLSMLLGASGVASGLEEEKRCSAIMVGKDATVDGSVMTTTCLDGWYDERIWVEPGRTWESGTMIPIYHNEPYVTKHEPPELKYRGEIPQVEKTYSFFHTGFSFMNEHQVAFGNTAIGGRPELRNPDAWLKIEHVCELGLARARTAREFIKITGALVEKYGYSGGAEDLTVADPNEVWNVEYFGPGPLWTPESEEPGALWVAQRVPDGHVSCKCNRSRIGEIDLDNSDYFMASPNVFSLAEEMGWYDPESGEPFVFYEIYAPKTSFYNRRREWRILSLVAPSLNLDPWAERYPFSVKPDKKLSVQDVMAIHRDHYEATEFDLTKGMAAGPFGTPDRYATPKKLNPSGSSGWERAISLFRCSYSHVSQLRSWLPDPIGGIAWFGPDKPGTTCYVPFYCGITKVPDSFSVGRNQWDGDVLHRNCAWWAFNFVSNWANLKYSYMMEDIKEAQKSLEGDFFAVQPAIEAAALELYEKDPSLAVRFLTNYSNDCANRAVATWWELADKLVWKYHDGYVYGKSVGYPEWWLEEVDFGLSTIEK